MSYSSMRLKNLSPISESTFIFEKSGHCGAMASSSFAVGGICDTEGEMLENSRREIGCSLEYKLDREGCPPSSAELRCPKSGVVATGDMARGRAAALQRGTTQRMILRNLKHGEEAR